MMFSIVLALMTAAAVFAVLWPLARSRSAEADRRDPTDVDLYRAQLDAIARDEARGVLSPADAKAAAVEAGRRLLAADAAPQAPVAAGGVVAARRAVVVLALVLFAAAPALYALLGSPDRPDQPLAARLTDDPARFDLAAAVAQVETRLARTPDDGRGHEVLVEPYLRLGRVADAERSARDSLRLLGRDANRLSALAEVLAARDGGRMPAEARQLVAEALRLHPDHPRARFYAALAAEEDGRRDEARTTYAALRNEAAASGGLWRSALEWRLAQAASPPGGEAGAAIAALPDADRAAAIGAMVDGLEARLRAEGGDPSTWARLVRARAVLGDRPRARETLALARAAHPGDATLSSLASELGAGTP